MAARAFPLQWPEGWKRTPAVNRRRAPYKVLPERATQELLRSVRMLGATGGVVLSTNVPLRRDGLPYADTKSPDDPGVAIYWTTQAHGERVMACDRWLEVHQNIRAIGLALEGLRAIDRAGATQILERAFTAFGALPPAATVAPKQPWWEVLQLPQEALRFATLAMVEAQYRELAAKAHPDRGGSTEALVELNRAREEAKQHFGGGRG